MLDKLLHRWVRFVGNYFTFERFNLLEEILVSMLKFTRSFVRKNLCHQKRLQCEHKNSSYRDYPSSCHRTASLPLFDETPHQLWLRKRQKFSADSPWNYDNTFLCIRREPESRRSFAVHFDSGCLRLVNKINISAKAYFTPRHRSGEGEGMLRTRVRRELMLGRLSSVIQFRL